MTSSLRRRTTNVSLAALALLGSTATRPLRADNASDIADLKAQIQALESKVDSLETKQAEEPVQSASAAAVPPPAPTPTVTLGDTGLRVASADQRSTFHLGTVIQVDSREFFNDGGGIDNNGFVLRRARLFAEGTLDKYTSFQFVPEFGGTSPVSVYDANVGIAPTNEVQFKFGKFKAPIGLEQLQAEAATTFVERSLATNLVPNRDLGAQVGGSLHGGFVTYAVGAFNGVPDAANTSNADFDNDKDLDARVFFAPFVADKGSLLSGLGAGVSTSIGHENGLSASASSVTAGYKTDGQQTFFKYGSTVTARGEVVRLSPQATYYHGPLGVLAEYVKSSLEVAPTASATAATTRLVNTAWDVQAGWVLTGEPNDYAGITPRNPFDWDKGTWGAWEVVARYADLQIDQRAFPTFASSSTNAKDAAAAGVGLNWNLSRSVRITADFFDTRFTLPTHAPSATQILNHNEEVLTNRVQFLF